MWKGAGWVDTYRLDTQEGVYRYDTHSVLVDTKHDTQKNHFSPNHNPFIQTISKKTVGTQLEIRNQYLVSLRFSCLSALFCMSTEGDASERGESLIVMDSNGSEGTATGKRTFFFEKKKVNARFVKSVVHDFFVVGKNHTGQDRYQCKFCGTQPLSLSSGAARKSDHILGTSGKGKTKKRCFPLPGMQSDYDGAVALLNTERNKTKGILKNQAAVRSSATALNRKRMKTAMDVYLTDTKRARVSGVFGRMCKDDVDAAWTRFFFGEGVSTRKAESALFIDALRKSIEYGLSYKPPRRQLMNGALLQNEVERLKNVVLGPLIKTIETFGATVESDGWTDNSQRPLLNFLIYSRRGVYYDKTVNTEGTSKDKAYIASSIINCIKNGPVDPENIVSVVMDGACRHSFEAIETAFPHLECQWCSAHVLALVLHDFAKEVDLFKYVVKMTKDAVGFIYSHQKSLSLFRAAKKKKELKKWCKTRFGTCRRVPTPMSICRSSCRSSCQSSSLSLSLSSLYAICDCPHR